MAQIHDLKILPEYYDAVDKGVKTYELRFDDRDFAVGDMLILREFTGTEYTGREVCATVTHILQNCGFGLDDNYAILSIKLCRGRK